MAQKNSTGDSVFDKKREMLSRLHIAEARPTNYFSSVGGKFSGLALLCDNRQTGVTHIQCNSCYLFITIQILCIGTDRSQ